MAKCPETIEELEALEQLLPLCKRTLYETAQAKIEAGAAYSQRDAARQIAEETGRPIGTVREYIRREETARKPDTMWPLCEKAPQEPENVFKLPICSLHTGDQESYTPLHRTTRSVKVAT